MHLAVRPGQDWALLLAMVKVILDEGLEHEQDCAELATGVDELRALVADADLDDLASRCDIPRSEIEQVARDFAAAPTPRWPSPAPGSRCTWQARSPSGSAMCST